MNHLRSVHLSPRLPRVQHTFRQSLGEQAALGRVERILAGARRSPTSLGSLGIRDFQVEHYSYENVGSHIAVAMHFKLTSADDYIAASRLLARSWDEKKMRGLHAACFITKRTGVPNQVDLLLTSSIPVDGYYFDVLHSILGQFR